MALSGRSIIIPFPILRHYPRTFKLSSKLGFTPKKADSGMICAHSVCCTVSCVKSSWAVISSGAFESRMPVTTHLQLSRVRACWSSETQMREKKTAIINHRSSTDANFGIAMVLRDLTNVDFHLFLHSLGGGPWRVIARSRRSTFELQDWKRRWID